MKGKLNTGNTFAEGMTNAGTFKSVEKRYCSMINTS